MIAFPPFRHPRQKAVVIRNPLSRTVVRVAASVAFVAVTPVGAAVTQSEGFSFLFGDATLKRADAGGSGPAGAVAYNFFDSSNNFATTPAVTRVTSGSVMDTATGTTPVATASVDASVTGTNTLAGGNFVRYDGTGRISETLTTHTLAGYNPPGSPAVSTATLTANPTYNVGLVLAVTSPSDYELTFSLANVVGNAVATANIVFDPDLNNDGVGDGNYVVVLPTQFLSSQDGSKTLTGTLPAGQGFYRISFTGGSGNSISTDDTTATTSADFTTSFAVTPEPAMGAVLAVPAALFGRRRRR